MFMLLFTVIFYLFLFVSFLKIYRTMTPNARYFQIISIKNKIYFFAESHMSVVEMAPLEEKSLKMNNELIPLNRNVVF